MMIVYNKTNIDNIWMMYEEYIKGMNRVTEDFWGEQKLRGAVFLDSYTEQ